MKRIGVFVIPVLAALSCGVVDTTDTGITAKLYNSDGSPAAGATVSIFEVRDTTQTPVEVVTTDDNGSYSVKQVKPGTYNIWAEKNQQVAFQNAVYLSASTQISSDTLGIPGSITATVRLQPNHDPRTVTVQVLGTYKNTNVDQTGRFSLDGLASGQYSLRLVSTIREYTPTYKTITIHGNKQDTLPDAIELVYTGIPAVTGLRATYDTLNGIVNLQWNKADYWDIQDYLIYRDSFDSISLSTKPVAWRTDTVFADKAFNDTLFPSTDTGSHRLKYRVAIRNNSLDVGITYKFAEVLAVSPIVKRMQFAFFPPKFDTVRMPLFAGDSIRIIGQFRSPVGTTVSSVSWKNMQSGSVIASKTFAAPQGTCSDSIRFVTAQAGICRIECAVTDSKAQVWRDTLEYSVWSADSAISRSYSFRDSIRVGEVTQIRGNYTYAGPSGLKTATWRDIEKDSILLSDQLVRSGYSYADSLVYQSSTPGTKRISCTLADSVGRAWTDTIRVLVLDTLAGK